MTDESRDRAIRVALALLYQPGAADAAEAWQVVGRLGRIAAELRGMIGAAPRRGAGGPYGRTPIPDAEPWSAAATELARGLEQATARWTGRSGFPWATWDESSAAALGSLLRELDVLATTLLTAAGSDVSTRPAPPHEAEAGRRGRRRVFGGRLVPSVGLAVAAVVGVIGGITIAATQVPRVGLPIRSIMSEPVPFTLHDSGRGVMAAGSAETALSPSKGEAGTAAPEASQGISSPASPAAGTPTPRGGPSTAASGPIPAHRQGSTAPQAREAGFPPPAAAQSGQDQLGTVVPDIHGQAEQRQEERLRELAAQMEAAMGLAIGLGTR